MENAWETFFDDALGETVRQTKQVPVQIKYSLGGRSSSEKGVDAFDLAIAEKAKSFSIQYWFPTVRMPDGEESRRNDAFGMTHVHTFLHQEKLEGVSNCLGRVKKTGAYGWFFVHINTSMDYTSEQTACIKLL